MIVDFEQDPSAAFGSGNFRDESGKMTYAYDPETAQRFVTTMTGASVPTPGAGAPGPSTPGDGAPGQASPDSPLGKIQNFLDLGTKNPAAEIGQQSTGAAQGAMGAGAPATTPLGKVQAFLQLGKDNRTAQNDVPGAEGLPGMGGTSATDAADFLKNTAPAPPAPSPAVAPVTAPPAPAAAPLPVAAPGQQPTSMQKVGTQNTVTNGTSLTNSTGTQSTEGVNTTVGRDQAKVDAQLERERQPFEDYMSAVDTQAAHKTANVEQAYQAQGAGAQFSAGQNAGAFFENKAKAAKAESLEAQMRQELAKNDASFDPNRFMDNMSMGKKIGMVILAALNGGFGALIGQKSNGVMDIINGLINQDLDAQKLTIQRKGLALGNLIDKYSKEGYDADQAAGLARARYMAAVEQMTKLHAERDASRQDIQDNASVLMSQAKLQRSQYASGLLKEAEDRKTTALSAVNSNQASGTNTTQTSDTDTSQSSSGLGQGKAFWETEKARMEAENAATQQQNAKTVSKVVGHMVSPEESKELQARVAQSSPNIAKTAGLVTAINNVVDALGARMDQTTGKVEWPSDLKGAGFLDASGGWQSYIPGYGAAQSMGLVRPDVAKVKAAQNALLEYLATDVTGATFSTDQADHFRQMIGNLDLGSEQAVKENLGNLISVAMAKKNEQMAALGPDGQAWYRASLQNANEGSQSPGLTPRQSPDAAPGPNPTPGAPPAPAPAPPGQAPPAQAPAATPPVDNTIMSQKGLTPGLKASIDSTAQQFGLNGDFVARIMNKETAGSFSPATVSAADTNHAGLFQWSPDAWGEAARIGGHPEITWQQQQQMTAEQQLPFAMGYLKAKGLNADSPIGQYYLALAAPAFMHAPDSSVIYRQGTDEVRKNPSWDLDRDGQITAGEIRRAPLPAPMMRTTNPSYQGAVPPLVPRRAG